MLKFLAFLAFSFLGIGAALLALNSCDVDVTGECNECPVEVTVEAPCVDVGLGQFGLGDGSVVLCPPKDAGGQ